MLKGDISNKPALSIVILLDDIVDEINISSIRHKLNFKINSRHQVDFLNRLFIDKDIRIIIATTLPFKWRAQLTELLDEYRLLFSELIFIPKIEDLVDILKSRNINLYTSNEKLYNFYAQVLPMEELTVGY
jgi:hypothetical protein